MKLKTSLCLLTNIGMSIAMPVLIAEPAPSTVQTVDNEFIEKIDGVLNAMQELFATMQNVAKWKWNHKSSIENMEKERILLEKCSQKGIHAGLSSEMVKDVFQAQLEAMKMIQINYFEHWKKDGIDRFADILDYKTKLKPQIEKNYEHFLVQLKAVMPLLKKKNLSEVIKWRSSMILCDEAIDDTIRDTALQPLVMFCAQVTMSAK